MSRIYRVLRKAYAQTPFDGEAYLFGGRWSSPGIRLSYASEHQSLAMLEYFVHLDQGDPPHDLVLAVAEFPDDIKSEKIDAAGLPPNWRDSAAPPELARLGDEFAERKKHCLLWVPSVLAPIENNCLINTAHPDYKKMMVREVEALRYDSRMFQKKPSRRRH